MKRFAAAVVLGLSLTVLLACRDDGSRTVGPEGTGIRAQQEPALEGEINQLIDALFPDPDTAAAHTLFADTKSSLAQGDTTDARQSASDLLELAAATTLNDPPGAQGYSDLIDVLAEFVGITPPDIDPSLLDTDGDDGTVAFALDGQDNLILTEERFAGTFIEDEDLNEDLVIVIERLTEDEQDELEGGECLPLPASIEQKEGCYQFDRFPEGAFQELVEVGVCQVTPLEEDFQLHKFETADEGVVALPNVDFPQLDCTDFTVARSGDSPLPVRWARAAWSATGGAALEWLGPRPLHAVDAGFGGSTLDFSRIGWAKRLDVDIVDGDGQTVQAGSPVPTDPQVRVTHLPEDDDDHPVQGVDVTFAVVEGGGALAAGQVTSVTDTTDSQGLVSVPWTLGSAGTNRLEVSVPGSTVEFTATATQDAIFQANFDDEAVGDVPQDPIVGTWTATSSPSGDSIRVQAQRGDLLQQPVVFFDSDVISGSPFLEGTVEGTAPTSGQYSVTWRMLTEQGAAFAAVTVRDGQDRIIAGVNFESGSQSGNITAVAAGTETDTNFDWNAGVARSVRVDVDLDAGNVSFAIDGDPVAGLQSVPFENTSASSIDEIFFNLGGNTNQVYAADDIVIAPQ